MTQMMPALQAKSVPVILYLNILDIFVYLSALFLFSLTNRDHSHCFVLRMSQNVSTGYFFICNSIPLCFVYG